MEDDKTITPEQEEETSGEETPSEEDAEEKAETEDES